MFSIKVDITTTLDIFNGLYYSTGIFLVGAVAIGSIYNRYNSMPLGTVNDFNTVS